jgi:hypothetical protein
MDDSVGSRPGSLAFVPNPEIATEPWKKSPIGGVGFGTIHFLNTGLM